MKDFSVLIGGQAGDGINQAGLMVSRVFNRLGYRVYIYYDYPSLIRGGHNFSIILAGDVGDVPGVQRRGLYLNKIAAHTDKIDCLVALNQETFDLHKNRLKENGFVLYDSDTVKAEGPIPTIQAIGSPRSEAERDVGVSLTQITKEEKGTPIMRNSAALGALCKALGIDEKILKDVFTKHAGKGIELNLKLASRGYEISKKVTEIKPSSGKPLPILTGNEAVSLGLVKGGLDAYIAYPMTPASSILHYLASWQQQFNLKVIHPENEISVILMAAGFAYAGKKVAVGSSGGGFCLMAEGVSLSGMAELPVTIIVSQRPGPSTGMPTYSAQGDLHFILNAGQGEFLRFVVAPGDAEEAYAWSSFVLNASWKYQTPSFIILDKTLSEGSFSFDIESIDKLKDLEPVLWDKKEPYKRYLLTGNGVSPLTFPSDKDAIIKINSYEHDEAGISIEESAPISAMQEKRLRKEKYLAKELDNYETVKTHSNLKGETALLCWGSNKGVCMEVGERLGLKVIQPIVLSPFPVSQFKKAIEGVKNLIAVENNITGQLVRLINMYGFQVNNSINKYDGRPFSINELEYKVKSVLSG
jgi:2-oxoglutarate ferredoxin oxidoreductase subunit alpha